MTSTRILLYIPATFFSNQLQSRPKRGVSRIDPPGNRHETTEAQHADAAGRQRHGLLRALQDHQHHLHVGFVEVLPLTVIYRKFEYHTGIHETLARETIHCNLEMEVRIRFSLVSLLM